MDQHPFPDNQEVIVSMDDSENYISTYLQPQVTDI